MKLFGEDSFFGERSHDGRQSPKEIKEILKRNSHNSILLIEKIRDDGSVVRITAEVEKLGKGAKNVIVRPARREEALDVVIDQVVDYLNRLRQFLQSPNGAAFSQEELADFDREFTDFIVSKGKLSFLTGKNERDQHMEIPIKEIRSVQPLDEALREFGSDGATGPFPQDNMLTEDPMDNAALGAETMMDNLLHQFFVLNNDPEHSLSDEEISERINEFKEFVDDQEPIEDNNHNAQQRVQPRIPMSNVVPIRINTRVDPDGPQPDVEALWDEEHALRRALGGDESASVQPATIRKRAVHEPDDPKTVENVSLRDLKPKRGSLNIPPPGGSGNGKPGELLQLKKRRARPLHFKEKNKRRAAAE